MSRCHDGKAKNKLKLTLYTSQRALNYLILMYILHTMILNNINMEMTTIKSIKQNNDV